MTVELAFIVILGVCWIVLMGVSAGYYQNYKSESSNDVKSLNDYLMIDA